MGGWGGLGGWGGWLGWGGRGVMGSRVVGVVGWLRIEMVRVDGLVGVVWRPKKVQESPKKFNFLKKFKKPKTNWDG